MRRAKKLFLISLTVLFVLQSGISAPALALDYITSAAPVTITNDVFTMTIPADVPYPTNIESLILAYCNWVQEASGLSFFPPGTAYENIIMRITNDGGAYAYGGAFGINVANMDYLLDAAGAEFAYLHELTHVLQFRLINIDCPPFTEAFAILNSAKAAKAQGLVYLYWHLMSFNYAYVDPSTEEAIISSDFETFYRTNEDGWDDYLYGFRFGVYLETVYGADIFTTIIQNHAAAFGTRALTRNEFVDFLLTQTNVDVFINFAEWYWQNKDLFEMKPEPPRFYP
ncbi:MAG: hypothetical protein FWD25_13130 [Clostridia bacterium]|nr:hypothetical protein [Clostridia bacterium]